MQIKKHDGQTYLAELSDDERQALLWAVETGRALLLDDPDISALTREERISAGFLDGLADDLFLVGTRPGALQNGSHSDAPSPKANRRL